MPGTTLVQPVRRMFQEQLFYAFSLFFLALNIVFSWQYIHYHLLSAIIGYWIARVRPTLPLTHVILPQFLVLSFLAQLPPGPSNYPMLTIERLVNDPISTKDRLCALEVVEIVQGSAASSRDALVDGPHRFGDS